MWAGRVLVIGADLSCVHKVDKGPTSLSMLYQLSFTTLQNVVTGGEHSDRTQEGGICRIRVIESGRFR